ncbi:MAG: phosphotransferase family protein [Pseudomonadota bacterium]
MTGSDLDEAKLAGYLEQHVPDFEGLESARKFSGGQSNPTYLLTAASGRYVLRRQPSGTLLKSAHAVDREFRVIRALAETDVPVPKAYHLCEDRDVLGSMFYVMEFCDGRVFWDAPLKALNKAQRGQVYEQMVTVLAAIHSVDLEAAGLATYGKPGSYFERQLSRWTAQYQASETQTIGAMDQLIDWLAAHLPADDGRVSLVHGDYRLDNLMFSPASDPVGEDYEPRVIAVLDWELSTLGHPLADLAYQCMQLRMSPAVKDLAGLGGLDRTSLGIPEEGDYVARYCELTGMGGIEHWPFYLAFSYFRLGAILQGVAKRALDGNASGARAARMGQYVEPLAQMALAASQEPGRPASA